MSIKTVARIIAPPAHHFVGDGFRVHNFIPSVLPMEQMDPFIMLDYNSPHYFPPTDKPRGVGVHPHRGFETVTIAYQGKVAHHDSGGGGGVISEGGVQWMTAASGVLHKEYHETEWSKQGGTFQMVQLWVNLPATHKMSEPKYQALNHEDIPIVKIDDAGSVVEVIAGSYDGVSGAASTYTPLHMLNAKLTKHAKASFTFNASYNTIALVIKGKAMVQGRIIDADHLVQFQNDGTDFELEAMEDSTVLILSGSPIGEPIAAHGPFVMNSRDEILQAFHDYNNGKFGFLDE